MERERSDLDDKALDLRQTDVNAGGILGIGDGPCSS